MATRTRREAATLNELIASEIRAWLGREMITGRELARRIGVDQKWVSNRVRGDTPISLNDLQRVADGLDMSWRDLLPDASPERPVQPTVRKPALTETTMIPHPRVSHPPFGGAVRTRPLSDIDQMTEPNRVVPASAWADRSAVSHYDPATPVW